MMEKQKVRWVANWKWKREKNGKVYVLVNTGVTCNGDLMGSVNLPIGHGVSGKNTLDISKFSCSASRASSLIKLDSIATYFSS